jgi:hypothetical protein
MKKNTGSPPLQYSFFAEDSPVNPTPPPENGLGKKMSAISGRGCWSALPHLPPYGLWGKTFLESLLGTGDRSLRKCVLTLKVSDTTFSRLYFQQQVKVRPTFASGSSLWQDGEGLGLFLPTPRATKISGTDREDFSPSLPGLASQNMLPTPTVIDCGTGRVNKTLSRGAKERPSLALKMKQMLPTPRATESIERRNMKTVNRKVETGGDVTLTTLAKYKGGMMLPTPTTSDQNGPELHGKGMDLRTTVAMLPTPTAKDFKNGHRRISGRILRKMEKGFTVELNDLATLGMLPTPVASTKNNENRKSVGYGISLRQAAQKITGTGTAPSGTTSQLNPAFVLEMMGFPPDWTLLPFLRDSPPANATPPVAPLPDGVPKA